MLERKNLRVFTKISFFIAMNTIITIPISSYISSKTSNDTIESILGIFKFLTFYASVFGIPLSIVSMFSKENFARRIFSLIVNLAPISILVYAFLIEFMDEFFQTPP
ncbi:2-acyl-glycerophospho-ethanolamine acyltransferase [Cytobacillus praedii]|uniref:2-acyl-glycerophospho-ethanolamine acyltransferase n=1 Tax=Cytobacillus praedii TaxID=1742358 RepID=UPI001F60D4E3|nr:2-acyl-glycerophospho-ethanolamine acyltransferase [Cytobacillus praedii]